MKVFNTLSRQKEAFLPQGEVVTMYVCGVTTYDDCHIGHAMSYVLFDVIRRYLEFKGYRLKYVQNFTDVDDKIIKRAWEMGVSPRELADKYIAHYFRDMDALNIKRADIYPRVTEEIATIVEIIQGLIDKGCAYEAEGDVYFRVKKFQGYGKLSHRKLAEMSSTVDADIEKKESPLDFALWKKAKEGEPFWSSPWGEGRPGWHIECSAMALKYLGNSIDIHGGGQDLIFPHHENEIAQAESYSGYAPYAKYWLHNGLLQLGEEKMSKSVGNLISVQEVLGRFSADALRLSILGSHYRSSLNYGDETLESSEKGATRLRQAACAKTGEGSKKADILLPLVKERFIEAMDDDFNTARATAVLFDLAREINRASDMGASVVEAQETLKELSGVLGLSLEERDVPVAQEAAPFIDLLISVRNELRHSRQWQMADEVREGLSELGIILEDTATGTIWKYHR